MHEYKIEFFYFSYSKKLILLFIVNIYSQITDLNVALVHNNVLLLIVLHRTQFKSTSKLIKLSLTEHV